MKPSYQIIPVALLDEYKTAFPEYVEPAFERLLDSELSIESFSYYTSVSAVYSSKIEGEQIELDSFIKHKRFGTKYKPDYTRKVDDLYDAYLFAQQTKLCATALQQAHARLTQNILQKKQQGKLRMSNMFVVTNDGKIDYVAATPDRMKTDIKKLYADIETLLAERLSFKEVFFYAAMLHVVFVKIHPFEDGNGRGARLLEKWFLAEKLGAKAWFAQSEKYYHDQHQTYYQNLRRLGVEYETLDYLKAMPFLQMLPAAIAT